uniref:MYB family transcription factor n=1 Tax=Melilotus albus TaxID=47082 RepID=A0A896WC37_MELAB|nr:MYB family transcription factor [Melilotus albus]
MDEVGSSSSCEWSREQDKAFEIALATHPEDAVDRWEKIAKDVPGKTLEEIKRHYVILFDDIHHIESGFVPLPDYDSFAESSRKRASEGGAVKKGSKASSSYHERRKGVPWTEAEHRLFLQGVEKHGWGDWRSISRYSVVTRTPTQVASHAQKYKIRQDSLKEKKERKKRSSIHDVTYVKNGDISPPERPITCQSSNSAASSAGQSAAAPPAGIRTLDNPPAPSAGTHAAPRTGQPIGGPVVSAVGTQVNLTAPGNMDYGLGPVSETVMLGVPMNLGPITYTMQHTYAHS